MQKALSPANHGKNRAVIQDRINALTKQVEKHNHTIERTFKLEQDMAVTQHDIESLKREEG